MHQLAKLRQHQLTTMPVVTFAVAIAVFFPNLPLSS